MIANFVETEKVNLESLATALRGLCLDTVLRSQSGHIGLPLGAAEIAVLLYFGVLKHNPEDPLWLDRDRFVLSAGHGSALLYGILNLAGYPVSIDDLKSFRQLGSITPGHPEFGLTPGVECTTGPLGQGVAMAAGMALAEAHLGQRFTLPKESPIDHRTFVLAGDGCLMEGVACEAISLAGHLKLNRLIMLYDDNRITIDGTTDISFTENVPQRFVACGWNVFEADGHDFSSLAMALDKALSHSEAPRGSTGPSLIVCRTHPGKSLSRWENNPKVHGNPHTSEDVREAKKALGIDPDLDFHVSDHVRTEAKRLIAKRSTHYGTWMSQLPRRLEALTPNLRKEWTQRFEKAEGVPFEFSDSFVESALAQSSLATRQASGQALNEAFRSVPALIGGSADLAGSNNTTLKESSFISSKDYTGSNIHFGVREHAMAAMANGLALHGGLRPYVATFAVFSDYMRPAIRLSALMKLPVVYVFTHDSYAVGEDGPTHQPIEQASSLRLIPGANVFRPADTAETYAAWEMALNDSNKPTVLLLTRQAVPNLDQVLQTMSLPSRQYSAIVRSAREGAMVLKDHTPKADDRSLAPCRRLTLVASGSEVAAALEAARLLESAAGSSESLSGERPSVSVRVVSVMDSTKLLRNPVLLNQLVPTTDTLIAIEAGSPEGLSGLVGRNGFVFGLDHFGESAPAKTLESHFGLTPTALYKRILTAMGLRIAS